MVSDPPPNQTAVDENGGRLTFIWQRWFSQFYQFVIRKINFSGVSVQVVTNGFSVTIGDQDNVLTLNPAGVLATGTIAMPAIPYDGQYVAVSSTNAVTALTVSPSGSATVKNAPTTLAAGIGFSYYYHESDTTWYRLS